MLVLMIFSCFIAASMITNGSPVLGGKKPQAVQLPYFPEKEDTTKTGSASVNLKSEPRSLIKEAKPRPETRPAEVETAKLTPQTRPASVPRTLTRDVKIRPETRPVKVETKELLPQTKPAPIRHERELEGVENNLELENILADRDVDDQEEVMDRDVGDSHALMDRDVHDHEDMMDRDVDDYKELMDRDLDDQEQR